MRAGIVDEHLDRSRFQQAFAGREARRVVGNVEGDALAAEFRRQRLGPRDIGMGMDDDAQTVAGKGAADRLPDRAAAAGDEGTDHARTTVARPARRRRPPPSTAKP